MSDTAYIATVLAEEISKQSVEGATWLILDAYSKMQKGRNKWKQGFLREKLKKKPKLKDFKNS